MPGVQRAFDAAMGPHGEDSSDHSRAVVSAAEPDASSAQAQAPFDVREGEPQPQQQPAQHAPLAERPAGAGPSWQPREVPKPKYVVAEKVERAEPEPLAKPQDPVPSADTKLKPAAGGGAVPEAAEPTREKRPSSMDLDKVLARRRA
ncbi:hypothetical protein [Nesterenkonia sp. NBAIMH1]|uniref:hypothetical protein n=1 Tax=Nesterenkonia sp. NBAIMH1 TaxID=2600320 RepID=UPI0011B6CED6|nr:hypothetical protein [Nesterenkonia sp. NBAIMH1]